MIAGLFILTIFLLVIAMIIRSFRNDYSYDDYETEIVVKTTVTDEYVYQQPIVQGKLQSIMQGSQRYVIDPADNDQVWLNSNDDMYEDGAGKIWELV